MKTAKNADIIKIDKDWWMKERQPSDAANLAITKKRRLPGRAYSIAHWAERLNVSVDVFYSAISCGEITPLVVGRQYRLDEQIIEDFLSYCARKKGIA
jgi:excisionase family DNA binding protein